MPKVVIRGYNVGIAFLCLLFIAFFFLMSFLKILSGFLFFEVLVILAVFPVASPSKSFRLEEAVAEVALLNHINMMPAAVQIGACRGWLHHFLAVFSRLW